MTIILNGGNVNTQTKLTRRQRLLNNPIVITVVTAFTTTLFVSTGATIIHNYQIEHPDEAARIQGVKTDIKTIAEDLKSGIPAKVDVKASTPINLALPTYGWSFRTTEEPKFAGTVGHYTITAYAVGIGDHASNYCRYDSISDQTSCHGKLAG